MKKKAFWMIMAVVVVIALFMHYAPVWVSVTSIISLAIGCIIGWLAHLLYNRHITER